MRDDELVLVIQQGVCGTAAQDKTTLRIADVREFAGHIVCDPASRSEIAVSRISNGRVLGLLDIDSPQAGGFSEEDQPGVESSCELFTKKTVSATAQQSNLFDT